MMTLAPLESVCVTVAVPLLTPVISSSPEESIFAEATVIDELVAERDSFGGSAGRVTTDVCPTET